MIDQNNILRVFDSNGHLLAIQIPVDLWKKLEPLASDILTTEKNAREVNSSASLAKPESHEVRPSDMTAFAEFLRVWDFPYEYDPQTACPNCGNSSSDWRNDSAFSLTNANVGGLLVFHCNKCGGTIRHKYFKHHRAVEYSPPGDKA